MKMKEKPVNSRLTKWVRTNDKVGVKPTFPVICHHCNEKMFFRNSELCSVQKNAYGFVRVVQIIKVMYKCIPCAQVYWFYVEHPYVDNDYWTEVLKWRNNHPLYVPPISEWSDDVKVQRRLKALGYIGGDIDCSETTELEE